MTFKKLNKILKKHNYLKLSSCQGTSNFWKNDFQKYGLCGVGNVSI